MNDTKSEKVNLFDYASNLSSFSVTQSSTFRPYAAVEHSLDPNTEHEAFPDAVCQIWQSNEAPCYPGPNNGAYAISNSGAVYVAQLEAKRITFSKVRNVAMISSCDRFCSAS